MINEYILFDETLRDRFLHFAASLAIPAGCRPDPIAGFVVELPADLPQDIQAAIELEYDVLMDLQRDLTDAAQDDEALDVMGVAVTLPDGQSCVVRLPAAYGRRLIEHFSFEEIHELVSVIANNVANPVTGPL